MSLKLSTGAISMLMRGETVEKPVFQILGSKKIAGQGGNDRFRLNISDGLHSHTFAMLATQLNHMIPEGDLDNLSVIRTEKLICNPVSEKRVLIILDVTVLAKGSEVGERIGNPVQYNQEQNGNLSNAPTQTAVKSEFPSKTPNSFYGQRQPKPSAPSPSMNVSTNMGNSNTNTSFSGGTEITVPIRDISPYNTKCTIKARVTNKTPIKEWSNSRGEGKLFSVDLLDESGEIRMTGFNKAVDDFYDTLKVNEVYQISKFSAKPANKQFTSINHEYEISFSQDTNVMPCLNSDSNDVPSLSFSFTEIAFIENIENGKLVDTIGVCKSKGDLQAFTAKSNGKEFKKRELVIVDRTNTEIGLTLWGKQAEDFDDDSNPVLAVKGVKVSDFNGKSVSMLGSSMMMVNPDIPEAHILRGWYDNEGSSIEAKSLVQQRGGGGGNAPWKMIREATSATELTSGSDKSYLFKSKVTVLAMRRENAFYQACTGDNCQKKVVDSGNGMYRCEKCGKDYPEFRWRLLCNVCFGDASDSVWATVFQDQGELLLGGKTEELGPLHVNDPEAFDGIIKQASFKSYTVKFRAKHESYNGESKLKYQVVDLQPMNFAEYAQKLVAEIKETIG